MSLPFFLSSTTITITRRDAGAYVSGEYTDGASSTFDVLCNIQPASQRDVMFLPEGLRTRAKFLLFTKVADELRTAEQGALPDLTTYRGRSYQLHGVESFVDAPLPHHEYILVETETEIGAT